VVGLIKTLAIEPSSYNVISVRPKTVDTIMINNQAFYESFAGGPGPDAHQKNVIKCMNGMNHFAVRGMLAPEDIGAVLLWLASEEARHLKGCVFPVDAGFLTR
jgi:NAD(P)-dependent dehydrogenase (short-subunit alcohol dehydrogenase family)